LLFLLAGQWRDLPYRAEKCLQIGKTPLRGIINSGRRRFMPAPQGALCGHQRLSWRWLFLIMRRKKRPHPKARGKIA
jgi:hypothetical protein